MRIQILRAASDLHPIMQKFFNLLHLVVGDSILKQRGTVSRSATLPNAGSRELRDNPIGRNTGRFCPSAITGARRISLRKTSPSVNEPAKGSLSAVCISAFAIERATPI